MDLKALLLTWATALCLAGACFPCPAAPPETESLSLHDTTVTQLTNQLLSPAEAVRAGAAANLGYLRAYPAADTLASACGDASPEVRREACLSLAWCGGRKHVPALLNALDDRDWSVRQAAWVSLTNLTGMEFPFDSHAKLKVRATQIKAWREWWQTIPENEAPPELLALLQATPEQDLAANCPVTTSSTYKGPPSVLTHAAQDGFWQTKNVPFPQSCTVDLGSVQVIECVTLSQYGEGFRMTDCAIEVSSDGKTFNERWRNKTLTPAELTVPLDRTEARYVRIVSYASERPTYPTTFYRLSVFEQVPDTQGASSTMHGNEKAMRALGSLGGENACAPILELLAPYATKGSKVMEEQLMVQAGIRALGRLGGPEAQTLLIQMLDNTFWARYAADALGDVGGVSSAEALIAAYPACAATLDGKPPARLPKDDKPGFEAVDRMYETPYSIALALSRFPLTDNRTQKKLRTIAPLLVANMAGDFDGAMIYEEQAFQQITAWLLDRAGVRREVCEIAFDALDKSSSSSPTPNLPAQAKTDLLALAKKGPGGTSFAASWLTALCRDGDCVPRLIGLLEHENGWVRINAAKTLMFMEAEAAAAPIATLLKSSKTEAEHGYFGGFLFKDKNIFGQDEYNAPSPNWREAFTRALGALGNAEHVPLLVNLLNDDRNALDIRYSAAASLDQIGTPGAVAELTHAATAHPFHSIRLLAREALWKRDSAWATTAPKASPKPARHRGPLVKASSDRPEAIVFIKGSNDMPNDFQIDIWRQTYSTTDSGPTYRLGANLFLMKPAAPGGKVTPLTRFTDGYVADCEVSWDGTHVVFARREKDDPWWHIYELELDTGDLKQLTSGPYHDVQPAWLPDGRIVFSSTRSGMRDEYHGYPATGLTVMNRDGSDIHCIGFNLGRDNEPSIRPDGSIVFSRLELFYSRLKTELTVQTMHTDGTMNQTLYGPEKRDFWRQVTLDSGEKGWGEAPPRHRVLRLTQPQPLGGQQFIVATTGGPTIVGPGRLDERIIPRHDNMAVTSPWPLDDHTVLCAATVRANDREAVDLGLYTMDVETGALTLLYNDPGSADFEARPVMKRTPPRESPDAVDRDAYTARLLCNSALTSQESLTRNRGKLVRIIEGQPITGRHHTHTNGSGPAWKNHTGTLARILGTVPLAADGSFYVEIPADRLIHCQVLDSDRRVVGNQLIWMYARPGETRGCVGCHEMPDTTPVNAQPYPFSVKHSPIKCLPTGDEFSYRGKAWQKGHLSPETEERTRTVNAVNLPGRF